MFRLKRYQGASGWVQLVRKIGVLLYTSDDMTAVSVAEVFARLWCFAFS